MKGLIVFLLLLACALCAVAQTQVHSPAHPVTQSASRSASRGASAGAPLGGAGISLLAAASGALACLFLVWSPVAASWRRRLGSRAELSALILALLLCAILAVQGCSAGSARSASTVAALTVR